MAASPATHRVLDTAAGTAVNSQLLLEAHEVLGALDFQADKIDVQVELDVQPPGFKVLLKPQQPPNHQPAGLSITYQGLRHVNSSGWIFGKELHGTCSCGARISNASPSQFKELVGAHIHSSGEGASSAAPPSSAVHPAPNMQAPAGPMDIDGEGDHAPAAQDAAEVPGEKKEPGTQPQPMSNGPANSDSHTDNTASGPPAGPSSPKAPAPQHAGSSNGDTGGAHAGSQAACKQLCQGWMSAADDASVAEELKTLAVMLGAACAGYSELLQPDSVDPATAAAFKAAAEAVLKDSSMRQQTCLIRPARAPPSHLADAAQQMEQLPAWCRRALQVPFTQWTLAQPWYLHIPVSRSHIGLAGADMCLPARRAASRIRSELPALHAFDSASRSPGDHEEAKQEPKVSEQVVSLKLQQLLKRTHDKRTAKQVTERLGVTMAQLCELVNMKELGGQVLDMCAWCGAHVRDPSTAVACRHCVDVFHLSCVGLKQMPLGEWMCPCCTLASGATDSAAAAALAIVQGSQCARSRMSSGLIDTALPSGSAPRAVPIQHAVKTSGLGVSKPSLSNHLSKDGVSTGEANPSVISTSSGPSSHSSRGHEASLPPMPVAARPPLQHYGGRGRGGVLGGRIGGGPRNMPPISLPPLGTAPQGGGRGVGGGGGASNSQQQQQQQPQQQQQQGPSSAAAAATAGGAHREGSSEATRKPTPPAASPAQGGLEALAAARAQGFARAQQQVQKQHQQQQQQQHQQQHPRHSPAKHAVHKQQQGAGSEYGVQGGGHAPQPHSHQLQQHRRHQGTASSHEQETQQGEGQMTANNHFTHHNNIRPHPPSAFPNNAHAPGATKESSPPSIFSGVVAGLPPAEGGDPLLYKTGLTNLPQPSAMGRALCARLAKELVERKVTPGSSKWRPQTLLSLNLLEGITCEYHHNVNTTAVPTSLSESHFVVGGVRCWNCRPLVGESNGPQVDESENLLASGPEPPRTNPVSTKPLGPCGKTFTRLIDYEQHLQMASGFAPVHIWLPKHCMYLQGFKGTRGLMELVAAEVYRSPALMSVCDPAAAAAAATAQQHQLQQGGATSASQDLNDRLSARTVSHQMPGVHVAVPPPRSLVDRQKLARQVQLERRQRAEDVHTLNALHPNKRLRHSKDIGLAPSLSPPHAQPQPYMSSIQLQLQRQQLRLYQMQQLRMSEPRVLARMEPCVSAFHSGLVKGDLASGSMYSLEDSAGGGGDWAPAEFGQEGGSEMVDETAATLLLAIAGRGTEQPSTSQHGMPHSVLLPPSSYPHHAAGGYVHSQHHQQPQLPFYAGPQSHSQHLADPPPTTSHPLSSVGTQPGLPGGPSTSHQPPPHALAHLPPYTQLPGVVAGGVQGVGGPSGAAAAAAAGAGGGVGNPATAARMASLKLMRRLSALSVSCRKDDSLAQAMIRTLKACREAANQISDAQLQLESMGFISDLLALTEEEVAALIKARQQQQQQQQPQQQQEQQQPQQQQEQQQPQQQQEQQHQQQQQEQQQHSCPGAQQGPKEEPEAQQQQQQQQPSGNHETAVPAANSEPAANAAPEDSIAQGAAAPADPAQASSKDGARDGAVAAAAAVAGVETKAEEGASASGGAAQAAQDTAEDAPAEAHTSTGGSPPAAPPARSQHAQDHAECAHSTDAAAPHRDPTPPHRETTPAPAPAHRDPTPPHKEPTPALAPVHREPTPAAPAAPAPAATQKPSPASATPPPAAITASEDSKLPQLLADAEDLQAQLEDWAGIPSQRQKHAS